MPQIIPYRDMSGAIIAGARGVLDDGSGGKIASGYIRAQLVYCPEKDGLYHVKHCQKCDKFAGHAYLRGVLCNTTKPNTPPACYKGRIV